jgi:hypothetical protein
MKNLFNIKYFEKILNRNMENLIKLNINTISKINAVIEKLERKNHSHNLPVS